MKDCQHPSTSASLALGAAQGERDMAVRLTAISDDVGMKLRTSGGGTIPIDPLRMSGTWLFVGRRCPTTSVKGSGRAEARDSVLIDTLRTSGSARFGSDRSAPDEPKRAIRS
jgi:hypothetical protein